VHVFDWGRSELNTSSKYEALSSEDRQERRKYWELYCEGVARLFYDMCMLYVGRYCRLARSLAFTLWDKDKYKSDDFIGYKVIPLEEISEGCENVHEPGGDIVMSGLMAPMETKFNFTVSKAALPENSRMHERWTIQIKSASDVPSLDVTTNSDVVAEVTGLSDEASELNSKLENESLTALQLRQWTQFTSMQEDAVNPIWNEHFETACLKPDAYGPFLAALTMALDRGHDPCTMEEIEKIFPTQVDLDEDARLKLRDAFTEQTFPNLSGQSRRSIRFLGLDQFQNRDVLRLLHFGDWLRTQKASDPQASDKLPNTVFLLSQ
jgi:hypothetical protein